MKLLLPILQVVLNLHGQSNDPCILTGEANNEEKALAAGIAAKNVVLTYGVLTRKMYLAYMFHEYDLAEKMATKSPGVVFKTFGAYASCYHRFFKALVAAQKIRLGRKVWAHRHTAKKHLRQLRKWAHNFPENVVSKVNMVQAELATLQGNKNEPWRNTKLQSPWQRSTKFSLKKRRRTNDLDWHFEMTSANP